MKNLGGTQDAPKISHKIPISRYFPDFSCFN